MGRHLIGPASYKRSDPLADVAIPSPLREYLADDDPARSHVCRRVLTAKLAKRDITDPEVLAECIAQGKYDHAAELVGADTLTGDAA